MLGCGAGLPYGVGFGKPAWPIESSDVSFVPVGPWNCDGLIVLNPIGYASQVEFIDRLVMSHYPVVFTAKILDAAVMTIDNYDGIRQAVDHLVAHGHRRIAYISGRQGRLDSDSQNRWKAYRDGIQHHGIAYDQNLVATGFHTFDGGQQAIGQILSRKTDFTAMIASNDKSAVGAMHGLQLAGLMVPQDVAVIGFDDRIDARAQIPMLTTVHYPMFELGYQAVDLLLKYIDGTLTQPELIRIPTRLMIRESCGCLTGMTSRFHNDQAQTELVPLEATFPALTRAIINIVSREEYHLGRHEVDHLCQRLVEALQMSLEQADPPSFFMTFQQILAHTSSKNNDLFVWHKVISQIRDWIPALMAASATMLTRQQADEMLNKMWLTTSEILQGQSARQQIRQAEIYKQMGELFAFFLTAHNDQVVFEELGRRLPGIGIARAIIAFQLGTSEDGPTGYEIQNIPTEQGPCTWRFPTWEFPPEGLYPFTQSYHLVILPLTIQGIQTGFIALETDNFEICSMIVQQVAATLNGMRLYREAIEARQIAEEEKRRVEEANRVKNRFLSWVIHELRTPVNLIYGLSDMLLQAKDQVGDNKILVDREDIDRFHIGAEHLVNLIRDVLDLSSSELGQLKLFFELIDLKVELDKIIQISSQQALDKGLVLRTEISESIPLIRGDRTRIRQIILNILNNAVKFTTHGEVLLRAGSHADTVMISVQDTGLGIPPGEQSLIFEEFRQSERTAERGFGGLGLGLAISKRLVEMHGGNIGVFSSGEEGKGSTFYFTLPAAAVSTESLAVTSPTDVEHKLVLLADDPAAGSVLKTHLERQGYTILVQMVGADTTDWILKVILERPEAVILDLGLASRLGWEILKTFKENPNTRDIPVLFCSLGEGGDFGSLLEFDYMTKPVKSGDLTKVLLSQGIMDDAGPQESKKTILIVDDEIDILELHSRMVQAQFPNSQVVLAHNGREALKLIHQPRPDLVLLDLMMPDIDGFAVLETMQKDEISRNIPVIVLTGQELSPDDLNRLNCGVTSVLGKGMYSQKEILYHLTAALKHHRKVGSETQKIVQKAMAFIHSNYSSQFSRKDMAEHVGLSERHLTRCFNLELGLTPMTYLNRYRVKQARQLLENGGGSIAEIAEKVGFSSGGYFSQVFRDVVGISPREYAGETARKNLSQNWKNQSFK